MTTKRAVWLDGSLTTGRSWDEVEEQLRVSQWEKYKDTDAGRADFREEMAARAWVWSRTYVDKHGTSEEFMRQLEAAGLLRIEEEEA
jgi:hypothetical protein